MNKFYKLAMALLCVLSLNNVYAQDFTFGDVEHWVGTGSDSALLVVDFKDGHSAKAFGYKFDGSTTGKELLEAVANDYPNFEVTFTFGGVYLGDISYLNQKGLAGNPDYFNTFTGTNSTDWTSNSGISETLTNGQWFGCSYIPYPAEDPNPGIPVATKPFNEQDLSNEDISYWVGDGENLAVLVVDFKDGESAKAFGYKFNGTKTGRDLLEAVAREYADFDVTFNGEFLNDIIFGDQEGLGANPNYFSTFSGTSSADWAYNAGATTTILNGSWFGCAYNANPLEGDPNPAIPEATSPTFAPKAGDEGSTAINAESDLFVGWANFVSLERGPIDIATQPDSSASHGVDDDAMGKADNVVVSLGDGGVATLEFDGAIFDGEGYDFAVFENSFSDTYLELAFVEVSSDGENFFRFPSASLTPTDVQVGGFGSLEPTNLHNLAGKYKGMEGTPFDLADLAGTPGLDVQNITHVRIVDVVGTIDPTYATYDSKGNIVNDPYATDFSSGGFDLDAVGVINGKEITGFSEEMAENNSLSIYPNPAQNEVYLSENFDGQYQLYNLQNQLIQEGYVNSGSINLSDIQNGIYVLKMDTSNGTLSEKIIISK